MLSIPIISEFDGKGIDKAIQQFKQLETNGEKAHFAISKAAIPAAAALAAVTGALGLAAKAAAEDEQQQVLLATAMTNTVAATDAQVKATEDMIGAFSRATGTADSELRPAFASLLLGTRDIEEATKALTIAQDVSIATGKSLSEVSDALAKAYGGNMKGLQALSPEIKAMIKEGATLDTVMTILADNFAGAAAASANTAAGKFKILKNSISETQESIGAALLPVVQAVLPVLQRFADWAQNNPKAFLAIAGAITAISVAIMAVNFAMALNPFTAIAAGVAALVVGIIYAYNKFEVFRDIVNGVLNGLMQGFQYFANTWISVVNRIIQAMNLLSPFSDISAIPTMNLPTIGGGSGPAAVGSGFAREGGTGSIGGIALPTMPSVSTPVSSGGGGGGGGGSFTPVVSGGGPYQGPSAIPGFMGGVAERIANRGDITINVTGGLATSAEIGESVVNSLLAYQRVSGPLDLQIAI
jgi:hypothetical protein